MTRIALAAAAVAATALAISSSPSSATSCDRPHVTHVHVDSLTAQGMSCDHARTLAPEYINRGVVHGYTCSRRRYEGKRGSGGCHHGDHSFHVTWYSS